MNSIPDFCPTMYQGVEICSCSQVCKKRIDASVQVTAQNVTTEAQTICTYPSNTATQYQYEVENTQELFEKCKKYIEEYTGKNVECIEDFLHVSYTIQKI